MTMILIDGFDHADGIDVWTSFSASYNTGTVRTGTRSATGLGAGGPVMYRALGPAQVDDGITVGAAIYQFAFQSLSGFLVGASGGKLIVGEGSTTHVYVQFRNDTRAIELYRGATLVASTDPNLWTHDTWHYLELGVKIADSGGTAEVRLNGVTVITYTGDTRNGGTGIADRISIQGNGDIGSAQAIHVDDVYMLNEQGSAPWNSFLGDTRCYPLHPNGNGNYSDLVGSDADSTNNYQLVDEVGAPSTADYVGSTVDGDIDTYLFEDISALQTVGTIQAVETRIYAAKTETGTKQMRAVIRRSATDAFGPDHILAEDSYATYRYIMELDPHAGPGAWTISNVDGTEFGVEVRP